ncbi:carbohydrate ABC transporter permease [Microbacterium sp. PRC9]|nr:carbohydrate ABC transporter permease [Microbacterium sp. PRC9]MDT0144822.1 carbohydrate ABC transporter permease [Microbacterium sp. PRC9]
MLFPVYWMVNVSLQPAGNAVETPLIPINFTLRGYGTALAEQGDNLVTSLIVSIGTVIVSLAFAAPAAYAMVHFEIGRWADLILFGVLITQMVPGIVVANALYTAYANIGLLNTIPGLILANASHGIPFSILLMRAFMGSLPPSIIEAAYVDGAGPVRAFISIVLPMSRNVLITAALFTFLSAWGDFLFALTLTTTDQIRPITLGLYNYIGEFVADWSPVMATAVLSSLPAIVLLVIAQKYVAAGISGGSVKS